jgi:hypothetical protein
MKITFGPAFIRFYRTLLLRRRPASTKSRGRKASSNFIHKKSFISELIDTPAQQNSEAASTKPHRHLIGIGYLELPCSHVISRRS